MPAGTTKFQATWLESVDTNSDLISTWCQQGRNDYEVFCILCKSYFSVSNGGMSQLMQHSKGKKHRTATQNMKGQMKLFSNRSVTSESNSANNANVSLQLTSNQLVTKSEALWAMKVASSNYSFASCTDIVSIFQAMFEGHPNANQMQISDRKVSYILSHGLGPHFQNEIINELKDSSNWFTLAFDETTTCQIKKQLDIYIRFWSEKCEKVLNAYINSVFLGHADSEKICSSIIDTLNDNKLPLHKLLMLSMDGPNVNLSVAKKLNERLALEDYPELVDFGTCSLHKVHNSFSKLISSLSLDIDQFCNDLFSFFKLSAARREDLKEIQKLLDCEEKFLLRHVNSRWITLGAVINRILLVYASLSEYFLQFLPQQKTCFPSLQNNSRYQRIVAALRDQSTLVYLEFISNLVPTLESYLTLFQNEGPLVHILYNKMNELMRNIMQKYLKESCIGTCEGKQLLNIDIENCENLKPIKDLDIGIGARRAISKLKESQRTNLRLEFRKSLVVLTKYLKETLPISNVFLKDLEILHPLMRKDSKDTTVMRLCVKMKPLNLTYQDIDAIVREWQVYKLDEDVEQFCEDFTTTESENNYVKYERVDNFWAKVLRLTSKHTGTLKYLKLSNLIKSCLSLSHGNADVERGFSLNNSILSPERASLSEKSIIGLRVVKDAVKRHGGVSNVPITVKLLNSVAKSYSVYKEEKMKEQEAAREQAQKRAQSQSENLNKKLKTECKEKLTDMKNYVKSLQDELHTAQALLNEGNDRLQKAIKNKNYKEISVVSTIIETGTSKVKKLNEKLAEAAEKSNSV